MSNWELCQSCGEEFSASGARKAVDAKNHRRELLQVSAMLLSGRLASYDRVIVDKPMVDFAVTLAKALIARVDEEVKDG